MSFISVDPFPVQLPLIITVDEDDQLLLNSADAPWYRNLKFFPDIEFRTVGARYYNALYHFNQTRKKPSIKAESCQENKDRATQRLLFERATMNEDVPIIYDNEPEKPVEQIVSANSISPGITPDNILGRKPKCFFAMFKSFIGASTMGFAPEPENVHNLLTSNLSFARVCGFVPKGNVDAYWQKHVPSLRKLEQFDQIMTEYGLWEEAKWEQVVKNLEAGVIQKENVLVGDTTHYHAHSGFETVTYNNSKGKKKKKSQSKTTKNCRCKDPKNCSHPYQLADDGAGTITKAHKKFIWGHKASILGFPLQGIPLDAVAVNDAATHDGETLYPHIVRFFNYLPKMQDEIDTLLYDKAADSVELKQKFEEDFSISLKTSLNPRSRKTVTSGLPRGMKKLTAYGNMICMGDFEMDYQGLRYEAERFIYKAPLDDRQTSVCLNCKNKAKCCPLSKKGRIVNISFDKLPHINPADPPMAKRFRAMMTRRPSVERMIKRLKCDLSDDRLKKRGNAAFQAYLDKTMIAFHMLLRS
jgi:hypothetical protein